jgi:hypothetical protein
MIYCGIDNGMQGGLAAINEYQEIIGLVVMPIIKGKQSEYDLEKVKQIFKKWLEIDNQLFIVLEKFQVTPILGRKAAFISGKGYGEMRGLLAGLGLNFEIVQPRTWQKEIFQGSNGDTKQAAIQFCKNKFNGISLKQTERCTKDHTGLADSLCMAVYCYRKNKRV